jgi:putative SOS response-associated peptidase YedK
MCNRFALPATPEEIAEEFELPKPPDTRPRYNIAPGETILVVREEGGARLADGSSWGLLPSGSRGPGMPLLNIRAETLRRDRTHDETVREGRCLVPAGGFYEWRHLGRARQPYYFRPADAPLFGLAAVSERLPQPGGGSVRHCAIVTTEPNGLVAPVHDRMPVIIPREAYALWLDPTRDPGEILPLLAPYAAERMKTYPVSTLVNRAGIEDPRCIEPIPSETLF